MPTGYTACIENGTVTELEEFVAVCASAFLGEHFTGKALPDRVEPDADTAAYLVETESEVLRLARLTEDEWAAVNDADFATRRAEWESYAADKKAARRRYDAMTAHVRAWVGAPDNLKAFMLEQLETGALGDCRAPDPEFYPRPAPVTVAECRARLAAEALRRHESAMARFEGNAANVRRTNFWLAQIRASLP